MVGSVHHLCNIFFSPINLQTKNRALFVAHWTFYQPPRCVIIYIFCDLERKSAFQAVCDRKCPLTLRSIVRKDTILNGGLSSFQRPSALAGQGFILTWDGVPFNIELQLNRLKFEKLWIEASRITVVITTPAI